MGTQKIFLCLCLKILKTVLKNFLKKFFNTRKKLLFVAKIFCDITKNILFNKLCHKKVVTSCRSTTCHIKFLNTVLKICQTHFKKKFNLSALTTIVKRSSCAGLGVQRDTYVTLQYEPSGEGGSEIGGPAGPEVKGRIPWRSPVNGWSPAVLTRQCATDRPTHIRQKSKK